MVVAAWLLPACSVLSSSRANARRSGCCQRGDALRSPLPAFSLVYAGWELSFVMGALAGAGVPSSGHRAHVDIALLRSKLGGESCERKARSAGELTGFHMANALPVCMECIR